MERHSGPTDLEFYRGGCHVGLGKDGVAASKNWTTRVVPSPPKWNEYIPKKNRHSESVPRDHVYGWLQPMHGTSERNGSLVHEGIKSVQHPVFPSGHPPQY